jgi:hypothetical protein
MKLTTYAGLGLVCVTLIMQRFDSIGLSVLIVGISLCIPEIVERIKQIRH